MGQRDFLATDSRGNKSNATAHAVTFVTSPVGQREIRNATTAAVSRERAEQEKVCAGRKELERTCPHVESCKPGDGSTPGWQRYEKKSEHSESTDDHRDHDPVEIFESPLDSPPDHQYHPAHQKQRNADGVDRSRFTRGRQTFRHEKEDRTCAAPAHPGHPIWRK